MSEFPIEINDLPGGELIAEGIADLAAGRVTTNACLVAMVCPHLRRVGIRFAGEPGELIPEPERTLYRLLGADGSERDPYPRYNALKRRIVSFARALAVRRRATRAMGG